MASQVEGDFLVDFANGGYLFKVVVTSAVARHGKHVIIFRKPLVAFDQFFGNLHQGDVARYFGLCPAGDNPFFAVEIHTLDLVIGECLYIYVAQSGETAEKEHITDKVCLFIHKHGIGYQFQFFFREVAPVGFLHFKAVLAERIGADNSPAPSLVGKAEYGHGVNPEGVCAQSFFITQVAVEIVNEVFRQFLVSHIGTLPLLPHEGFEVLVNGQVLVIGGLRTEFLFHHFAKFPVHGLEVFKDAVLHHADA